MKKATRANGCLLVPLGNQIANHCTHHHFLHFLKGSHYTMAHQTAAQLQNHLFYFTSRTGPVGPTDSPTHSLLYSLTTHSLARPHYSQFSKSCAPLISNWKSRLYASFHIQSETSIHHDPHAQAHVRFSLPP